jgi:hypothetical protein
LLFLDERADEKQLEALNMIITGKAGGFMSEVAKFIGEIRGMDYTPIKFEISDDLSRWSAEIPGKVLARVDTLTGPTTPPGKRVRRLIHLEAKQDQELPERLQHGVRQLLTRWMQWVSNGNGMAGQASIYILIGVVLKY